MNVYKNPTCFSRWNVRVLEQPIRYTCIPNRVSIYFDPYLGTERCVFNSIFFVYSKYDGDNYFGVDDEQVLVTSIFFSLIMVYYLHMSC